MKITIGITTYNRLDYVKRMATSLSLCHNIQNCNVRVYDDCSQDYTIKDLRVIFNKAISIVRRENNLGADYNMHQMFCDFLLTEDDYLIIADSDLIFNPNFLNLLTKYLSKTESIISLYNSANHSAERCINIENEVFVEKMAIGAAGSCLSRQLVSEIIQNVPKSRKFDWEWSKFISSRYKILVFRNSLAQHIGSIGQNSDGETVVDIALNFYPGNTFNEHLLIEFFQELILSKDKYISSNWTLKTINRKIKTLFKITKYFVTDKI